MKDKPNLQDVIESWTPEQIQQVKDAIQEWSTYLKETYPDRKDAVRASYKMIDQINRKHIDTLETKPSCKKGCSYCCHIPIKTIQDEVSVIAEYCKDNNISIDKERLREQSKLAQEEYIFSPFKKCVFLSDAGECNIYPVRPSACRNYFVFGDPKKNCDTDGPVGETPQMFQMRSILTIMGLFDGKELESFPEALLKELD